MSNKKAHIPIAAVGNFTKNAVENFEENMVNQTNYLEKTGSIKSESKK
ncbi:MAG: hypothetical protein ACRC2K_09460 [Clostridium sp.]